MFVNIRPSYTDGVHHADYKYFIFYIVEFYIRWNYKWKLVKRTQKSVSNDELLLNHSYMLVCVYTHKYTRTFTYTYPAANQHRYVRDVIILADSVQVCMG